MAIYGNVFKPVDPEIIGLAEATESELIKEATELGLFTEAKFHLMKIGDSKEYKDLEKDLKDAEQILNANNDSLDVNKVGSALLHGTDKIVSAVNAGTSVASLANIFFLPIALTSKLASLGLKSGKEKEALALTDQALDKLSSLLDTVESEAEKNRIQGVIDKLLQSKHTLEVGKKGIRKEEKAVKKEEKAITKQEKKDAREEKRALKKAAKDVKRNKDDEDDEEITAEVESTNLTQEFIDFCIENGIEIPEDRLENISNILEGKDCENCAAGGSDDIDDNDREEVNDKAAEELTTKKESSIYDAFRALVSEASDEQIEAMLSKMNEATGAQLDAAAEGWKNDPSVIKKVNKSLAKKLENTDKAADRAERDLQKAADKADNFDMFGTISAAGKAVKSTVKATQSAEKADKALEKTIDHDEKTAYKENEKRDKKAADAKAKADAEEAKKAAKLTPATESYEELEDMFNFVMENDIEITEDLYNQFVEAGLLEAPAPEFKSFEEYTEYCLENGIQVSKEELEAVKESFINESGKKSSESENVISD